MTNGSAALMAREAREAGLWSAMHYEAAADGLRRGLVLGGLVGVALGVLLALAVRL